MKLFSNYFNPLYLILIALAHCSGTQNVHTESAYQKERYDRGEFDYSLMESEVYGEELGERGPAQESTPALRPRRVAKTGNIEIPAGMHLITDAMGGRWLLPIGMEEPPERQIVVKYFKRPRGARDPRVIGRVDGAELLDSAKNAEEVFLEHKMTDRLPEHFAKLVLMEKELNNHALNSPDLKSLGKFAPTENVTFKLPYIPIPEDEMDFAFVSEHARAETKDLVRFTYQGRKHVRYFIHPNYVEAYEDLIRKYGIVYHFEAMTTASPRSLIVMEPGSSKVYWIKPSVHKKLDGSVRINIPEKVHRSVLITEALYAVPDAAREEYGLKFMYEPASLKPKGNMAGTIFREVEPELLRPRSGSRWIPGLVLNAKGQSGDPVLWEMIRKSGQSPSEFVDQHIVRPLLQAYINMGVKEGLPGELHVANFYYELNSRGLPTGKLVLKDNDGFRFDTELALRNGRKLKGFAQFSEPFYYGKYAAAVGEGAERIPFLGSWYYKLIRNVSGFETLAKYCLDVLSEYDSRGQWNKDKIQKFFDDIALEEIKKVTGIAVPDEARGYGADKGMNYALNRHRARLAREAVSTDDSQTEALQDFLKREWNRLDQASRVSAKRRSLSDSAYLVLHKTSDGAYIIEARASKRVGTEGDPTIGFALVENDETAEGRQFAQRVRTPTGGATRCRGAMARIVQSLM